MVTDGVSQPLQVSIIVSFSFASIVCFDVKLGHGVAYRVKRAFLMKPLRGDMHSSSTEESSGKLQVVHP